MPNIVGGDQFHPAYNPSVKLSPNEVLVGNDLYTLEVKNGYVLDRVSVVRVDGTSFKTLVSESPRKVQKRAEEINAIGSLNGLRRLRRRSP